MKRKHSIRPDDLPVLGFRQVDELRHDDLITFLLLHFRRRGIFMVIWWVASVLSFLFFAFFSVYHLWEGDIDIQWFIIGFLPALVILFLLIPLHEGLHGLAYKWAGASRVSYQVNWQKFYVAALADCFVLERQSFYVVALTPFVVVSIILLIAVVAAGTVFWQIVFSLVLLFHTLSSLGDFVMIHYMQLRPEKEVVTFDDNARNTTFFWAKDT